MKFVLLIYQPAQFDAKALPEEVRGAMARDYAEISAMPNVEPGLPLGRVEDAVAVRVVDGKAAHSSGPFVDEAGAVGGYFVVDVESLEEAVAIAARVPAARLGGAVEVRPAKAYW